MNTRPCFPSSLDVSTDILGYMWPCRLAHFLSDPSLLLRQALSIFHFGTRLLDSLRALS